MSSVDARSTTAIPSLDGWRAVAISLVFLSHAGLGDKVPGGLGVTIFFFLSGYLITTLLLKEFRRTKTIGIGRFYVRRVLRLAPALVITLVPSYLLVRAGVLEGGASYSGFLAQLFYFANYYALFFDPGNTTPAGTGIFWSLAVEEHFYLVLPALTLLLLGKAASGKLPWILFLACLCTLVWRVVLVGTPGFTAERTYYATDTRIDSLLFGCILATWWSANESLRCLDSKAVTLIAVSLGVAALLVTIAVRDAYFRETVRYTVQGIALMPLFLFSIKHPNLVVFRPLNSPVLSRIGEYSYSIYLSHHIMLINTRTLSSSALVNAAIAGALSLSFAVMIDRWVDAPFQKLRARYR